MNAEKAMNEDVVSYTEDFNKTYGRGMLVKYKRGLLAQDHPVSG